MPTLAQYVTRCGQYLNAFPMTAVADNPLVQAAGGKPGFPNEKIERAVYDAAATILYLIASNATHPRRAELVTATAVAASGDILPAHVGPIGAVRIAGAHADQTSADDVGRLAANVLGLTLNTGYFGLDGERIYFTGTPCTVDLVILPDPPDPSDVPSEFANAVVARALAFLFPKEGENLGAGQHFDQIATRYEQMVVANQVPPVVPDMAP